MATKYSEQVQETFAQTNPLSRKNVIINGNMDVWQRGTSFTGVTTSGQWGADRFVVVFSGLTPTYTVNRSTSVPSGTFNYSFRTTPTVADASVGNSDHGAVRYRIEGYDLQHLMGKVCTLSFWIRQTQTGIHCIALSNGSGDRTYVMEYTINQADTWEFKELTFTMHDGTSGTWDFLNDTGLSIFWTLAAGSNFQTTKDTWQTGNYRGTSNTQNFFSSTSNVFLLKQVQLELGPKATDFEIRNYVEELTRCQRYYESGSTGYYPLVTTTTTSGYVTIPMKVPKRVGVNNGTIGISSSQIYLNGVWYNTTSTNLSGNANQLIFTYIDSNHTYVSGGAYLTNGTWTVDVEP